MRFIPRARTRPTKARWFGDGGRWYRRPLGAARLECDRSLLKADYPTLDVVVDDIKGKVSVLGTLHFPTESGITNTRRIRIELPADYPTGEPAAYEVDPRPDWGNLDAHVFDDGKMCLWLPARSPWRGSDATALLHFLDQVSIFIVKSLIYEIVRRWPGPVSAHGHAGYVEYVCERLGVDVATAAQLAPGFGRHPTLYPYSRCPCQSGKDYKWCHLPLIRELNRAFGPIVAEKVANMCIAASVKQTTGIIDASASANICAEVWSAKQRDAAAD